MRLRRHWATLLLTGLVGVFGLVGLIAYWTSSSYTSDLNEQIRLAKAEGLALEPSDLRNDIDESDNAASVISRAYLRGGPMGPGKGR